MGIISSEAELPRKPHITLSILNNIFDGPNGFIRRTRRTTCHQPLNAQWPRIRIKLASLNIECIKNCKAQ